MHAPTPSKSHELEDWLLPICRKCWDREERTDILIMHYANLWRCTWIHWTEFQYKWVVWLYDCTERRLWLTFVSDGSGESKGFRLLLSGHRSRVTSPEGPGRKSRRRQNRRSSSPSRKRNQTVAINTTTMSNSGYVHVITSTVDHKRTKVDRRTKTASRRSRSKSRSGRRRRQRKKRLTTTTTIDDFKRFWWIASRFDVIR